MNKEIPNPGSEEAVKLGCTCAILDNNHGKGMEDGKGATLYWISADCPIHSKRPKREYAVNKRII